MRDHVGFILRRRLFPIQQNKAEPALSPPISNAQRLRIRELLLKVRVLGELFEDSFMRSPGWNRLSRSDGQQIYRLRPGSFNLQPPKFQ